MSDVNGLHDLFLTAAETDRRMLPAMRKQKLSSWPDYPLDWHGYGWTQEGETILKPTSRQITDYDRAMQLTVLMDEDDRKLVWAVAHSAAFKARGASWTRLARMLRLGSDGRVVKRRYMDALVRLHYRARAYRYEV